MKICTVFFCLEGGTSDDPLFHSGCACRPDSGMSIGHIYCFQEFARASFTDDEKRKKSFDCDLCSCSNCSQPRNGTLLFEICLILWKLHYPECLGRQNVQGINMVQVKEKMMNALKCLNQALMEKEFDFVSMCRVSFKNIIFTKRCTLKSCLQRCYRTFI